MEVNVTLLIVGLLCTIAAVSIALIRQVLLYSRRANIVRLQDQNRALSRKQDELTKTYRDTQEAVKQAEVERKALLTQLADAQRRVKQAREENYVIIHELGEPGGQRRLFVAPMTLGSTLTIGQNVVKDTKFRTVRHVVELWADNLDDANRMVRTNFPADGGFNVSKPAPPSSAAMAAE